MALLLSQRSLLPLRSSSFDQEETATEIQPGTCASWIYALLQDPGYLQLECVPRSSPLSSEASGHPAALLSCRDDDSDEAVAWQPSGQHLYTFSIAYQPSYCVPILLFQGQHLGEGHVHVRAYLHTLSLAPQHEQYTLGHPYETRASWP